MSGVDRFIHGATQGVVFLLILALSVLAVWQAMDFYFYLRGKRDYTYGWQWFAGAAGVLYCLVGFGFGLWALFAGG